VSAHRTVVVDNPAAEVADRLAAAAGAGMHIALTGGSTPRVAYELLADMAVDWEGTTLWFGDDRCVPPDHEHSNYGMAKRALFDRISGPGPIVNRIEGERGPDDGAADYVAKLRAAFPGDEPPQLDLILLGLGPDAHCASLFPGNPELGEQERWAVGVNTPGMAPLVPRVTLTFPVLNAAREVVFLVTGADKAPAVHRAFVGPAGPDAPGSLVDPRDGELTLVMDAAAAAGLDAA
jgi:6-phosphogluconolactonase